MRRILFTLSAASMVALLMPPTATAWAHGGQYRGPAGEVPGSSRDPNDPPPPPEDDGPETPGGDGDENPPVTGDKPDGEGTGGGENPGPGNGGDDPDSGGGIGGPVTDAGGPASRRRGKTAAGFEDWTFWWNLNKEDFLVPVPQRAVSGFGVHGFGRSGDAGGRVIPAAQAAVANRIVPLLREFLNDENLDADIRSAAGIGLAKIGDESAVETLMRLAGPRGRGNRVHRIVQESAALSLGLLARDRADVRQFLVGTVADQDENASFVRPFAAISLGLIASENVSHDDVREALLVALANKESKGEVHAAALLALGLSGDVAAAPALLEIARDGRLKSKGATELGDVERAYAIDALGRLGVAGVPGDSDAVTQTLGRALTAKKESVHVRRSAAIALGRLGSQLPDAEREQIVGALLKCAADARDSSERNFALIGVGRIAAAQGSSEKLRSKAIAALSHHMEKARPASVVQPFAALALGLVARAEADAGRALEEDVRAPLRKRFEEERDPRVRAAFAVASGLARDPLASSALVNVLTDKGLDARLRGYSALALGMIGDTSVTPAVREVLLNDADRTLRIQTALAAALLQDGAAIPGLVKLLGTPDESQYVLGSAALALGQLSDERAIDALTLIARDERDAYPALTRALAVVALGQIGDRRKIPLLTEASRDLNYRAQVPSISELLTIL